MFQMRRIKHILYLFGNMEQDRTYEAREKGQVENKSKHAKVSLVCLCVFACTRECAVNELNRLDSSHGTSLYQLSIHQNARADAREFNSRTVPAVRKLDGRLAFSSHLCTAHPCRFHLYYSHLRAMPLRWHQCHPPFRLTDRASKSLPVRCLRAWAVRVQNKVLSPDHSGQAGAGATLR